MKSILISVTNPPAGYFQWQIDAHNQAIENPRPGLEAATVKMIQGWANYAAGYRVRFDDVIGNDGYCADYWKEIGYSLRKLLSSEMGKRLDAATLDSFILGAAEEHGVKIEL